MANIELLTLANHAEVQNGLLYVNGAEWDTLRRSFEAGKRPERHRLSIALSVVVPWTEANLPQHVTVWIEDEDSKSRLLTAELDVEVGRPPGRPHGSDFRAPLAITANVDFPSEGGYRVVAEVGDAHHRKMYAFRVVDQVTQVAKAS